MNGLMDSQSQGPESRYNSKSQSNYELKNSYMKCSNQLYEHYNEFSSDYDNLIRMNNELYDNELCCNGDGVLTNKSMHTTNQMYENLYDVDLPSEVNYLKANF